MCYYDSVKRALENLFDRPTRAFPFGEVSGVYAQGNAGKFLLLAKYGGESGNYYEY